MLRRLFAVAVIIAGWFGIAGAQDTTCYLREAGFPYLVAHQGNRAWKYTLKLDSDEWSLWPGGFHSTGYLELGPNESVRDASGLFDLRAPGTTYSCGSQPMRSDEIRWPASVAERVAHKCESAGYPHRIFRDLTAKSVIEPLKLGSLGGYAILYAISSEPEVANLFVIAARDECVEFKTSIMFRGDEEAALAQFHELAAALTVEREPEPPRDRSENDPLADIDGTIWDYFERESRSR